MNGERGRKKDWMNFIQGYWRYSFRDVGIFTKYSKAWRSVGDVIILKELEQGWWSMKFIIMKSREIFFDLISVYAKKISKGLQSCNGQFKFKRKLKDPLTMTNKLAA